MCWGLQEFFNFGSTFPIGTRIFPQNFLSQASVHYFRVVKNRIENQSQNKTVQHIPLGGVTPI